MAIIDRFKFQYGQDQTCCIDYEGREYQAVLYEKDGPIVRLTQNMPEKRHALNERLYLDLMAGLHQARDDDEVRVVVIRANGPAFGSGFDISSPPGDELAPVPPKLRPSVRDFYNIERRRCVKFEDLMYYPKFTIAQVHGPCIGGHEVLSSHCDFTIAAEDAVFGRTGHGQLLWGIDHFPLWPHLSERTRVGRLTLEMSAAEAEELGLINKVVPRAELEAEVARWAQRLARVPKQAGMLAKEWFGAQMDIGGRSSTFRSHYDAHLALQWVHFAPDEVNMYRERRERGLTGFFVKRAEHQTDVLKED